MSDYPTCPIWRTYVAVEQEQGERRVLDSPRTGGKFSISRPVEALLKKSDNSLKTQLTLWLTQQRSYGNDTPEVTESTIHMVSQNSQLSIGDRARRILAALAQVSPVPGQAVYYDTKGQGIPLGKPDSPLRIYYELLAKSGSTTEREIEFFLKYLEKHGLIELENNPFSTSYFVTVEGYERLGELANTRVPSSRAFVAMWFDKSMEDAWSKGIVPAVRDAGYHPVRVDKQEHGDKIDDRIIAEIRRSRFIVADFTHGGEGARGGVYFEAGFARGLSIPVIWCCREDMVDAIHFDTRQYNHIFWTSTSDLRSRLNHRIEAWIGKGPVSNTSDRNDGLPQASSLHEEV